MINPRRVFLSVLTWLCLSPGIFSTVSAQVGGSFFADFQLRENGRQGLTYSMAQDGEGNLQLATLRGVVVFDGAYSQLVGTGSFIYKLEYVPEKGKVYAACAGRFGFLTKNSSGKFSFSRIAFQSSEDEEFAGLCHIGQDVYFMSPQWVVKVTNDKVAGSWKAPSGASFTGIFPLAGKLFVNVENSGLHILESGSGLKKYSVNDGPLAEDVILFAFERGKTEMLLGTASNKMFVFNGATLNELSIERSAHLQAHTLWQGGKIDNNQMVLATRTGGLMVVNMYSGALSELYSTASGFPDDQVSSMLVDNHNGIWVSHDQGLTRIDRSVPIRNYSAYPGITTRITSVAEINGTLYAGTADGVYYLRPAEASEFESAAKSSAAAAKVNRASSGASKQSDAEEPVVPSPDADPAPTQDPGVQPGKTEDPAAQPGKEAPAGTGKKLREMWKKARQRGSDAIDGGSKDPVREQNPGASRIPVSYYSGQRSVFRFASNDGKSAFQFIYSKIQGIEGKTRKLVSAPQGLICATSSGLYQYGQDGVKTLFRGDIQDVVNSGNVLFFLSQGKLFASNAAGEISSVTLKSSLKNLYSLLSEKPDVLWVGASNKAIRITLNEQLAAKDIKEINMPTDFIDLVTVVRAGNSVYFAMSSGLFEYNPGDNTAVPSRKFSNSDEVLRYTVNSHNGNLFIRSQEGWVELKSGQDMSNVYLMDVIGWVRYAYQTTGGALWVIGGDGHIYQVKRNMPGGTGNENLQVFIRSVNGFAGNAFDMSNLRISHDEAEVEIRWGANVLLNADVTWYQYRLLGAGKSDWSPWTNQTSLKIRLQPGSYTFEVRARDAIGRVSPVSPIKFTIDPPFWQTWWFYTLLGLLLAGAIYFIFRWRNRALLEKQKVLESMVKTRTEQLEQEKEKAENLLLNILPAAVAEELQNFGKSSVRRHDDSAVMFTDFCDFTLNSKGVSPQDLVHHLDVYFRKFDHIVEKYGLEKIKTIGDAYMCAAGVPEPKKNSTLAIVMAGLEMLETVKTEDYGWKIRIGIHQGDLVSGVVGKKKFAYDIWGDTVNIASRMESSSQPMNINISEPVYHRIKEYFDCEVRGEVEAKSLGKTNMYFVKGLKSEWSENGNPIVPGQRFLALLN